MGIELPEISLYITKSSMSDGKMKWTAVNSDTSKDLYGERMTLDLYRSMIKKINANEPPPSAFKSMVCSEYWCGGMPYLSIAHYPDADGKAVPGQPSDLFVDGEQLKAKGVLFENDLGKQVWKSLKLDENNPINDERIRISIAFLDLAHKHGENGKVFVRNSMTDVCPECVKKAGNKIYLDGYLVHLALTRKPVNPRTIMQPEDIMAKKSQIQTRKEDAASIVGDELANEIEKSALETKSDALIEMSDTPVVEESKKMDSPDEDESAPEDEEEDKMEGKGKKDCSLTEGDIDVIKSLISESLSPLMEFAKTKKDVSGDEGGNTEPVPEEDKKAVAKKSVLDIATDELYNSVNSAIQLQGVSIEHRLESINPALGNLGSAITALVRESMGEVAPAPVSNDQAIVLEAVSSLTNTVKELAQELAMLKEKSLVAQVPARVPAPRSIQAQQLVTQSQTQPVNPNSVANIVRRSVSSSLPLK
jgi:hypothetical protein